MGIYICEGCIVEPICEQQCKEAEERVILLNSSKYTFKYDSIYNELRETDRCIVCHRNKIDYKIHMISGFTERTAYITCAFCNTSYTLLVYKRHGEITQMFYSLTSPVRGDFTFGHLFKNIGADNERADVISRSM